MPKIASRASSIAALLFVSATATAAEKGSEQINHFYGNFSYSIPLEVPAFHGLEPRLALSYGAGGGNGQLGVGWTLSGLSTIELRGDGYWWLDGQQLHQCANYAPAPGPGAGCTTGLGAYYFTKDESFVRIQYQGNNTFHVYGKDGTKTSFSTTVTGGGGTFRFGQTSVVDTKGNTVAYAWTPATGDDSYPSVISYNGYSVTLYKETRPDLLSFGALDHVGTSAYRLKSIAVRSGTNLIRAYKLAYATSSATGRSLLTSVQVFGKDASVDANGVVSGGTSLPAQTFTYQNDAIAHQFTPTSSGGLGTDWCSPNEDTFLKTGDFNGDGKTDLICTQYGNIRVALSNGTGFTTPSVWGNQYGIGGGVLIGDYNNDGKSDFAFVGSSEGDVTVSVSLSTGSSFQSLASWGMAQYAGSCAAVYPGDYNGDGFVDLFCRRYGEVDNLVGVSTGSAFTFVSWGNLGCDDGVDRIVDVNGDGRDDWVCHAGGSVLIFRSTGYSFVYPQQYDSNCGATATVWADVNGDGRTDITCLYNGTAFLATGSWPYFVAQTPEGAFCSNTTSFFAADVDGDGASEIVCNNPGVPGNDIQVWKWSGTAFGAPQTWLGNFCGNNLRLGDFSGDGRTDIACANLPGVAFARAGSAGLQADLMGSASNGLGGTVQVAYTSSTSFTNTNNPPPKWAITSLTRLDGRGGSATTNYSYSEGLMDRNERRFLGFRRATETFPANSGETSRPYHKYVFRQDLSHAGKLETLDKYTSSGVMLEREDYFFSTNGLVSTTELTMPRRSFVIGKSSYTYSAGHCDPGCSTARRVYTRWYFDTTYGNLIEEWRYGDVYQTTGDETTSTFAFYPNTSAYIVDRLARSQVFAGFGTGGTKLSERRIYYDGAGSWSTAPTQGYATKVEDWRDLPTSTYVASTTSYDSYGNPTVATDPTNRSVTTDWDSTFHVFPVSVSNGANETVLTAWDPICGVPTSTTNPNGQVTTFAPADALCRPTTTTDVLGGFETRSYLSFGDPNNQRVRVETPSGDGIGDDYVEAFFDGFGRTWKTVKRGPTPSQDILTLASFQPRSGVATQTEPHYSGESARTRSFKFDALNRLIETKLLPSTVLSTTTYGLWQQTTTDENGKSVTARYDAFGRQKQGERTLNGAPIYTNSSYDLLGRLTGMTDHLGHAWSWSFDSLGRNIQKSDPTRAHGRSNTTTQAASFRRPMRSRRRRPSATIRWSAGPRPRATRPAPSPRLTRSHEPVTSILDCRRPLRRLHRY